MWLRSWLGLGYRYNPAIAFYLPQLELALFAVESRGVRVSDGVVDESAGI